MKSVLRICVLLGILSLGLSACSTDDDNGPVWYRGLGRVEAIGGDIDNGFDVRLDNGSLLVINNSQSSAYRELEDGDRIQLYFTLLQDLEPEDGEKSYLAALNYYEKVLSKKPVLQSYIDENAEEREAEIGNDPIRVDAASFGGQYLNIRFSVAVRFNSSQKHFINLVADDVRYEDGVMDVYLRHNGFEDVPMPGTGNYVYGWSVVSFDLLDLIPEGADGVELRLHWTQYTGTSWSDTVDKSKDLGKFVPYKNSYNNSSAIDMDGSDWSNME